MRAFSITKIEEELRRECLRNAWAGLSVIAGFLGPQDVDKGCPRFFLFPMETCVLIKGEMVIETQMLYNDNRNVTQ
jgi:hypothetical protein